MQPARCFARPGVSSPGLWQAEGSTWQLGSSDSRFCARKNISLPGADLSTHLTPRAKDVRGSSGARQRGGSASGGHDISYAKGALFFGGPEKEANKGLAESKAFASGTFRRLKPRGIRFQCAGIFHYGTLHIKLRTSHFIMN
jgi:hypothetical protein